MPSPFDPAYLMQASPAFGPLAWVFYSIQIVLVIAGVYLIVARKKNNAARAALNNHIGIAMVSTGGIGVVIGALRLMDVAAMNQRYWFYALALIELIIAAGLLYYARVAYPKKVAAMQAASRSKGKASSKRATQPAAAAKQRGEHAAGPETETRAVAQQSGRREARRGRKRKKR